MLFIGKRLSVKSITLYFFVVASYVFFTMLSDCFISKQLLNYLLLELNREGKTIIVVNHDEKVAERMNRVICLSDGKIISDKSRKPL